MKLYIVNAFSKKKFRGNPAAVVPLLQWLREDRMQHIAAQNNLAETAFVIPEGKNFHIRWFTPTVEVDLCGHATLATAHVYFNHLGYDDSRIVFNSKSGQLPVQREKNGSMTLDFPVNHPVPVDMLPAVVEGLKAQPVALYHSRFDYLAVFDKQSDIEKLSPDFRILNQIKSRGLIATAKGDEVDFVSRCFFPQSGIDEDPVTGSAHTVLVPFWAGQLGRNRLSAIQLSQRRGWLDCELAGDRVLIGGFANTYLEGQIYI
jgi:PhzF family phenazine biosynthesis protein